MVLALICLAVVVSAPVLLSVMLRHGMREVRALLLRDVDLSKLADDVYTGAYHRGGWTYGVDVTVKDHRIVSIIHTSARVNTAKDWNEQAAHSMLDGQAVHVDVVSGATLNTKAFGRGLRQALSMPELPILQARAAQKPSPPTPNAEHGFPLKEA